MPLHLPIGAVKLVPSKEGFAGRSEDVIKTLKAKHSPSPEDLSLLTPPDSNLLAAMVTATEESTTPVNSFPSGSA